MTPLNSRIRKVVSKLADAGGYAVIQLANTGVEYGFANPDFKAKEASDLLVLLIYIEIATLVFIPICAFVYLVYLGGVWLYKQILALQFGWQLEKWR